MYADSYIFSFFDRNDGLGYQHFSQCRHETGLAMTVFSGLPISEVAGADYVHVLLKHIPRDYGLFETLILRRARPKKCRHRLKFDVGPNDIALDLGHGKSQLEYSHQLFF